MIGTEAVGGRVPLDVPIRAFAGRDDIEASPDRMRPWASETTARFELEVVEGGHFFAPSATAQIVRLLAADLG